MSNPFLQKCTKEIYTLLKEVEGDKQKAASLLSATSGAIAILMIDFDMHTVTAPVDSENSFVMQILPTKVLEAADKAIEEHLNEDQQPIH